LSTQAGIADDAKAPLSALQPHCHHARKQETADNAEAPSSAPLPQPPLLREQVRDGQQCQGIASCAFAIAIVVIEQVRWLAMPRHPHLRRCHRCLHMSKQGTGNNAKVPSSAPLPPPPSLRDQVRDG
jgi:hypothetical protein